LDREIRRIAEDPNIGEEMKGDLRGISGYKLELKTMMKPGIYERFHP